MDDEEDNKKLEAPADFNGPTESRRCTDILWLGLLIASWVAMTGVGLYGYKNGDYRLVLFPMDYDGNVCGTGMFLVIPIRCKKSI